MIGRRYRHSNFYFVFELSNFRYDARENFNCGKLIGFDDSKRRSISLSMTTIEAYFFENSCYVSCHFRSTNEQLIWLTFTVKALNISF